MFDRVLNTPLILDEFVEYDQTHEEAWHVFNVDFGPMHLTKLEFLLLTVSS